MFRTIIAFLFFSLAFAVSAQDWQAQFPKQDISRRAVDLGQIASGGPSRDGIPAILSPEFIATRQENRIPDQEPVLVLTHQGETRAYPLRYLMFHEIVNDEINGYPVLITFCPLCNSALAFERRVDGQVLSFGVSGLLRHSDMVMYDHQSESFWQQALGEGIIGQYTGAKLQPIALRQMPWREFVAQNPNALVMNQPNFDRPYGKNPYTGYDQSSWPMLYAGEEPPHGISPLARVVRVGDRAWLMERIAREGRVEEGGAVISWQSGMNSALDAVDINQGRDVGSIRVTDQSGRDLPHDVMFAFAFHAFFPDGQWMIE